jgi:soluble lytic murein transglycosylase
MAHARFGPPASLVVALTLVAGAYQFVASAQSAGPGGASTLAAGLAPTNHAPLPGDPTEYLLVPPPASGPGGAIPVGAASRLARGVALVSEGDFKAALPLLNDRALISTPVSTYAMYYAALALKGLDRLDEAAALLIAASASEPVGYLDEAVPLLRSEIAIARGDAKTAVAVLESIEPSRATAPEVVLSRLAAAAEQAGDVEKALRAYRRVFFEFPLSAESAAAGRELDRLRGANTPSLEFIPLEFERAETLFGARRWADARQAFASLGLRVASPEEVELAQVRVAECDFHLNRARQARQGLAPFLESSSRRVEARFYTLAATRALRDDAAYVLQARRFIEDFPNSAWTAETLDGLASYYIVADDDASADEVFRELLARFPRSQYAERAAWKVGWAAYRARRFSEAAQLFDEGAANAPRSDYRPSWLYWSARAYDQLENPRAANARYRLTVTDYQNSYYGRLASTYLTVRRQPPVARSVVTDAGAMPAPPIPTNVLVRTLVGLGLYDDALRELRYAERMWGDSSALQATAAWVRHHRAAQLMAMDRFQNLRGAINQMKRAYPQYLAAGGEALPADVLKVIFPLDYWPLIRAQAEERGLDPYLMAALVAQESTFTADIRSSANAYGLMQLIPSTGRRYATKIGLRGFTTAALTRPETNVRLGMTYFKELMDRFGGAHLALASYNAGENRVEKWLSERPGVPQDEFIDDIPFPETQAYVKRILGTAEDYRRLYGGGILVPGLQPSPRLIPVAAPVAATPPARVTTPAKTRDASRRTRATRRNPVP